VPVEQRDPQQTIKAVGLGIAAVIAAVGFIAFVLWVTDRGGVELSLGDDVFEAGRADLIADAIDDGGPIIYGDLLGGAQNIILQHVGSDPAEGWFAFDLIRPGQPDDCQLDWDGDDRIFRDVCDPDIEIPSGGGSQPSYPVEINDDNIVVIDFRFAEDAPSSE